MDVVCVPARPALGGAWSEMVAQGGAWSNTFTNPMSQLFKNQQLLKGEGFEHGFEVVA